MYINVPGKVVLAIIVIRESCKVHKRSWEGSHGPACHAACNKRELYINVPGEYVLAVVVIRENCTKYVHACSDLTYSISENVSPSAVHISTCTWISTMHAWA
jgi:hypothetical protein